MKSNNSKAQGTIEYLVIIAIVIVIGLLVVGLSTSFLDSSKGVNIKSGKIIASTGPISITEAAVDIDGDGLINLQNNTGETLTITRITLGEIDNNFNLNFAQGDTQLFSLNELGDGCSCIGNEGETITCNLTIHYTTQNNITKNTATISIPVECDNNVQPAKPTIHPTLGPCGASPIIGTICTGGAMYAGTYNSYHYMVAPEDGGIMHWSDEQIVTGASDVNNGVSNTTILVGLAGSYPAAEYCNSLDSSGYVDWFLPAKDEFTNLLHSQWNTLNLHSYAYISSTESSSTKTWIFDEGYAPWAGTKLGWFHVKCLRKY